MIHHIENHIDRMRQQPDHKKRQYAFLVSLSLTAIIFVFWLASFGIGTDRVRNVALEVKSPLESVTASASDAFKYAKDFIFGSSKVEYSSDNVEVVPGRI
jgi:hypothetical protein